MCSGCGGGGIFLSKKKSLTLPHPQSGESKSHNLWHFFSTHLYLSQTNKQHRNNLSLLFYPNLPWVISSCSLSNFILRVSQKVLVFLSWSSLFSFPSYELTLYRQKISYFCSWIEFSFYFTQYSSCEVIWKDSASWGRNLWWLVLS